MQSQGVGPVLGATGAHHGGDARRFAVRESTPLSTWKHYDGADPEAFIERTSRWVDAARIAGVRQFVYLSDIRAYGIGRRNPYQLPNVPAPTRLRNIATWSMLNPTCPT